MNNQEFKKETQSIAPYILKIESVEEAKNIYRNGAGADREKAKEYLETLGEFDD